MEPTLDGCFAYGIVAPVPMIGATGPESTRLRGAQGGHSASGGLSLDVEHQERPARPVSAPLCAILGSRSRVLPAGWVRRSPKCNLARPNHAVTAADSRCRSVTASRIDQRGAGQQPSAAVLPWSAVTVEGAPPAWPRSRAGATSHRAVCLQPADRGLCATSRARLAPHRLRRGE